MSSSATANVISLPPRGRRPAPGGAAEPSPEPSFSLRTDLVVLAGSASGVLITVLAAYPLRDAARFLVYLTIFTRLLSYWAVGRTAWGRVYRELLGMGVIAGFVELLADWFLIHGIPTGQLVYPRHDAVLLDSPVWMPFAWTCVITELGYLILRLRHVWQRTWLAALVGAPVAGVAIGFYEYFAYRTGWWSYQPARYMIGPYCALFIPVAEVIMFLAFAPIFVRFARVGDGQLRAVGRGAAFGAMIFVAYAVAYGALEGLG